MKTEDIILSFSILFDYLMKLECQNMKAHMNRICVPEITHFKLEIHINFESALIIKSNYHLN